MYISNLAEPRTAKTDKLKKNKKQFRFLLGKFTSSKGKLHRDDWHGKTANKKTIPNQHYNYQAYTTLQENGSRR